MGVRLPPLAFETFIIMRLTVGNPAVSRFYLEDLNMRKSGFAIAIVLMIGMFCSGRRPGVTMKMDRFLATVEMVKVALETTTRSHQRIR